MLDPSVAIVMMHLSVIDPKSLKILSTRYDFAYQSKEYYMSTNIGNLDYCGSVYRAIRTSEDNDDVVRSNCDLLCINGKRLPKVPRSYS